MKKHFGKCQFLGKSSEFRGEKNQNDILRPVLRTGALLEAFYTPINPKPQIMDDSLTNSLNNRQESHQILQLTSQEGDWPVFNTFFCATSWNVWEFVYIFSLFTPQNINYADVCVSHLFSSSHTFPQTHLPKPKAERSTGAYSVAKNNLWNILLWFICVCVSVCIQKTHQFNRGILSHVYLVNHRQLNFCVETWP